MEWGKEKERQITLALGMVWRISNRRNPILLEQASLDTMATATHKPIVKGREMRNARMNGFIEPKKYERLIFGSIYFSTCYILLLYCTLCNRGEVVRARAPVASRISFSSMNDTDG